MTGLRLLSAVTALLVSVLVGRADALDPTRTLGQLHHSWWTVQDGAPPDVWALAQSNDGYLWLGTGAGLYRFDGVSFEKVVLSGGDGFPSSNITALYASPTGDLWIGYVSGDISRFREGRLTNFSLGMPNSAVWQITGDRAGMIWAVLKGAQHGGVVSYDGSRWAMADSRLGLPAGNATSILAARDGTLWVNVEGALFVKRPSAPRFIAAGIPLKSVSYITEDASGGIWVSSDQGGRPRLVAGPQERTGHQITVRPPPAPEPEIGRVIVDRNGSLWGTYQVGGIFRLASTSTSTSTSTDLAARSVPERFSLADGLTSDIARPLLEDREGNIWVGTNLGLDRFRATNVAVASSIPPTSRQGYYVAPGLDGTVYVAMGEQLFAVDRAGQAQRMPDLPTAPTFLFADRQSTVWIGLRHGLARLDRGRARPVPLPAAATGLTTAEMQDDQGRICIAVLHAGIFCRDGETWRPSRLGLSASPPPPWQMVPDRHGRIWLNYENELAVIDHSRMRRFSRDDGLAVGKIGIVADGPAGALVGGDFGLARYDGHRFVTLDAERHPALSRLAGIATTATGDTWLNGITGAVHIAPADLAAAFARPERAFRYAFYDMKDGLPGVAQQDSDSTTLVEASDHRLWFVTSHGMAWIDPNHLVYNPVPPPVSIKSMTVEGVQHPFPRSLDLPAGSSHLEVDFTALSLTVPERVRFRYRLLGVDSGWVEAGSRRQAFYTNLGPGSYRFQVIAANNDGIWNRTGASVSFVIPPTFVESYWFKLLLAAAALLLVWFLYSLRVRQITDQMRGRLEERLRERERIARELHDTLLQGFQGLVFRFQAAIDRLQPENPVRPMVERALDQADEVLAEGRNRVLDLRAGKTDADISDLLTSAAERALATSSAGFRIVVEGKPHKLHRIVQEELCRIAEEALANAAQHSDADSIEANITYRSAAFSLAIRDNGKGMDAQRLAEAGRTNHFGITGMRERAEKIGATVVISSHHGAGTEIALSIAASLAYTRSPVGKWRLPARRPAVETV